MPERKFDLGDYVEVKDRIKLFYELYAQGRLVTADVQYHETPDGTIDRVSVRALAYRTPDDPHPAVGWSWMQVPGTTTYTRGSELENTETSAWGRAIAATGILIDRSIASAQEVQNKDGVTAPPRQLDPATAERLAGHDPGGMVGIIEEAKDSPDFLPHIDPVEGYVLTFKLKADGKGGGIKAIATGPLAEQLADAKDEVFGARVTAWGRVRDESFTNRANRLITYQVLELDRVSTPIGILPKSDIAEGQESLPFDAALSAQMDAEEVTA
jgi:hypothetical protein